jgi:hypothetical protein
VAIELPFLSQSTPLAPALLLAPLLGTTLLQIGQHTDDRSTHAPSPISSRLPLLHLDAIEHANATIKFPLLS